MFSFYIDVIAFFFLFLSNELNIRICSHEKSKAESDKTAGKLQVICFEKFYVTD